jgi:hypothetical protein
MDRNGKKIKNAALVKKSLIMLKHPSQEFVGAHQFITVFNASKIKINDKSIRGEVEIKDGKPYASIESSIENLVLPELLGLKKILTSTPILPSTEISKDIDTMVNIAMKHLETKPKPSKDVASGMNISRINPAQQAVLNAKDNVLAQIHKKINATITNDTNLKNAYTVGINNLSGAIHKNKNGKYCVSPISAASNKLPAIVFNTTFISNNLSMLGELEKAKNIALDTNKYPKDSLMASVYDLAINNTYNRFVESMMASSNDIIVPKNQPPEKSSFQQKNKLRMA